jgi:arylsulfatase A-like enzyme
MPYAPLPSPAPLSRSDLSRSDFIRNILPSLVLAVTTLACPYAGGESPSPPNIVILYADDLGYGDLACQNPGAKLTTPNLDRLAREGMRFTDAHSSSGICSPSRFALLTGQYHWRRQHDIVGPMGPSMFRPGDVTLPMLLKQHNYRTACIGKWHLGWDWKALLRPGAQQVKRKAENGRQVTYYPAAAYDWTRPIPAGPLSVGFDSYFGDGTINFPPYCWIEDDHVVEPPEVELNLGKRQTREGSWEFRPGPMVKDWDPYRVLPTLAQRGVEWIRNQSADQPFFLYFAFPSPHAPIIPNEEFVGKTQAGAYGDFVYQTDWVAGQLLAALDERGLAENTLVFFSSDNGPERYAFARMERHQHESAGPLRGLKRDVWEGGHRVPMIARWPGKIAAGSVSDEVVSQIDLMATIAAATGQTIPTGAAPDSYNLLPVLLGDDYPRPLREATVHNTWPDIYAIRQGHWLLIDAPSGEHSKAPESYNLRRGYLPNTQPGMLFDLGQDLPQRENLYAKFPAEVARLQALLTRYRTSPGTAP